MLRSDRRAVDGQDDLAGPELGSRFWSAGPSAARRGPSGPGPRSRVEADAQVGRLGRQRAGSPVGRPRAGRGGTGQAAAGRGVEKPEVRAVQLAEHQLHDRRADSMSGDCRRPSRGTCSRTASQSRLPSCSSYQLSRMIRRHVEQRLCGRGCRGPGGPRTCKTRRLQVVTVCTLPPMPFLPIGESASARSAPGRRQRRGGARRDAADEPDDLVTGLSHTGRDIGGQVVSACRRCRSRKCRLCFRSCL